MKGGKNGIFHKMNASTSLAHTVTINLFFNIPLLDSIKAEFFMLNSSSSYLECCFLSVQSNLYWHMAKGSRKGAEVTEGMGEGLQRTV